MAAGAMLARLGYGIVTTGSQLRSFQPDQDGGTSLGNLNQALQSGWELQFARGWLTPTELRALLWAGAGAVDPGHLRRHPRAAAHPALVHRGALDVRRRLPAGRPRRRGCLLRHGPDRPTRPRLQRRLVAGLRGRGRGHPFRRRQDRDCLGLRRRYRPERPLPVAAARGLPDRGSQVRARRCRSSPRCRRPTRARPILRVATSLRSPPTWSTCSAPVRSAAARRSCRRSGSVSGPRRHRSARSAYRRSTR